MPHFFVAARAKDIVANSRWRRCSGNVGSDFGIHQLWLGVPRAIASGLPAWVLGVVLHFFIALSAATIYFPSSQRLAFLKEHFFVSGLFYGIAVFLVMNLIVVPLSAPFKSSTFKLGG